MGYRQDLKNKELKCKNSGVVEFGRDVSFSEHSVTERAVHEVNQFANK
jgi:hypothetical protein